MGKMHELLAVESTITGNYNRDTQETLKVLGRADLFTRSVARKEHFSEDQKHLNTTETSEITTTVPERLDWYGNAVQKFIDIQYQKDKTNQTAMADLTVDGKVLVKDVPATTLLMLESKLQDFRKVLEAIPTLPSGYKWEFDSNENLWKNSEPAVTFSTKKTAKPVVMYEATKEHPAQVKEVFEDVPVAKITKDTYSGMVTSAYKADLLSRLDKLLQACKEARQRANNVEAAKVNMAKDLLDFLFKV